MRRSVVSRTCAVLLGCRDVPGADHDAHAAVVVDGKEKRWTASASVATVHYQEDDGITPPVSTCIEIDEVRCMMTETIWKCV